MTLSKPALSSSMEVAMVTLYEVEMKSVPPRVLRAVTAAYEDACGHHLRLG